MDELFMNDSLFSKPEPLGLARSEISAVPNEIPKNAWSGRKPVGGLDLSGEATRDVSREHEHENDHQKQPQDAARAIAPVPAVTPGRQAAQEQHHENDQQEQAHEDSFQRVRKKADAVEHPEVFDHVGLLFNQPPGMAGLLFI
jgi:hypothetical protein